MAQLGEFARAKVLLRSAARAFGVRESVARARCIVAEAEIALASRDLLWPEKMLAAARATLERHGDRRNAAHATYIEIRRLLLIGRVGAAEEMLSQIDPAGFPPAFQTTHELLTAGIAMRRVRAGAARAALTRAETAAGKAGIAALSAEVESAIALLNRPTARLIAGGEARPALLSEVACLLESNTLVVDACRYAVRRRDTVISLATRPVLFALLRALGEAWPGDESRDLLIQRTFGARTTDESHRARLRVELGRLRLALRSLADIEATGRGFRLDPHEASEVVVLARQVEDEPGDILALLADGESWSSSALSIALGRSQRTVQRALDSLASTGKIRSFGRGRARRWIIPPLPGFATALLLPVFLPVD